jgi:hypothetical protein
VQIEIRPDAESVVGILDLLRRFLPRGFGRSLVVEMHRLALEAQQREQRDREDEEEARRPDVALAPAGEVFAGQETGPQREREERPPHPAVERDVAAGRVAQHRAHGGQCKGCFLAAIRTVRAVGIGAAIATRARAARSRQRRRVVHRDFGSCRRSIS